MKVSIITVVFSDPEGLEKTLFSIQNISSENYESIIVNGGDDSETLEIINKYKDNKTKVITEKDSGIYNAMNKGIRLSSEEIVTFLNAGDTAEPNYVTDILNSISTYDYIYSGVNLIAHNKKIFRHIPKVLNKKKDYLQKMPFTHPGLAVKMDCFRKLGFFNEKKKRTADHYWIISLIQSDFTGKRCEFVNVNFFLGGSSMSIQGINEMYDTAREFNRNKYLAVIYYLYGLINLMYYKILNN